MIFDMSYRFKYVVEFLGHEKLEERPQKGMPKPQLCSQQHKEICLVLRTRTTGNAEKQD